MKTYFHQTTFETRIFDEAWFEAAVRDGNPKVAGFVLRPDPPTPSNTQHAPEWVSGEWVVRDKSTEEMAAERVAAFPAVSRYQVRQWMIVRLVSQALAPDPDAVVDGVIDAAVSDAVQRVILKDRWRSVVVVPRDHLLVNPVGAAMGLTPAEIDAQWAGIAAL